MYRFLLIILFVCFNVNAFALKADSLYVISKNDKWYVMHTVKQGEDVFLLSRRYHVPPVMLANANEIDYQTVLKPGRTLLIPIGNYNQVSFKPSSAGYRNLYYRVGNNDNLSRISHFAGVQQQVMQQWNHLTDNTIQPGRVLSVGWILFDAIDAQPAPVATAANSKTETAKGHKPDTMIVIRKGRKTDSLPKEQSLYLSQTDSGKNIMEEKGSVVFFGAASKIKGTNMYFAFHNTARKGTIIKVHNPGNDKTVYVKVIGPLPETKQYYNSEIGINIGAKQALGISDDKGWVELSYAPN